MEGRLRKNLLFGLDNLMMMMSDDTTNLYSFVLELRTCVSYIHTL